jgi:hydroxymethylbilane synthase
VVVLKTRIRLGTRGSRLALAQTRLVADLLTSAHEDLEVVTVPLKTAGDLTQPERIGTVDRKAAFTGEIERQLLAGSIDAAVHSMKDLPIALDDRLTVAATPRRGDARDALVSEGNKLLSSLREGARIGTSSVRRRAQLLATRRDLNVTEIHGNVETRIRKIAREELDGVVLATAGLERAGLDGKIAERFATNRMVPAVCQGILAVQARRDQRPTIELLGKIDDPATHTASVCERAFAEELGADCNFPTGAFAHVDGGSLAVIGMVATLDGKKMVRAEVRGSASAAAAIGRELAAKVGSGEGRLILEGLKH